MPDEISLLPPDDNLPALYADETVLKAKVEEVRANVRGIVKAEGLNAETPTGREALRSLAYRVSQGKSRLLKTADALTADARAAVKRVTTLKSYAETELDALRDETKAPAVEWDRKEQERVAALSERLAHLAEAIPAGEPSSHYRTMIDWIESFEIGEDWQEFTESAADIKARRLGEMRTELAHAEKREADAKELEELRAAKAQLEAEARERDRLEQERQAREQLEKDRQAFAAIEAEQAARRAQEAAQAEVERERVAALREQEAAARAAEAERKRIADEKAAEAAAQAKRDANAKLWAKARSAMVKALAIEIGPDLGQLDDEVELAGRLADALRDGRIPHCTVTV